MKKENRKKGGVGPTSKINKTLEVYEYMRRYGKITTWDAFVKFKATRLSGIIWNLRREGYNIVSEWKENKDGTRYKVYQLIK